jgi:hypothetical protein
MPCSQCGRPAFYQVGDEKVPLCLNCWHKWQQGMYMQFIQNAAMINQSMDDMDMISGISLGGGRIPVAALAGAMNRGSTYNNISINNSTVGVLNTGDLARIDAVITLTKDTDVEPIGEAIKALTQAIIDSKDVDGKAKKEIIDLVQSLAEQVVGSQGQRKPSVISTLLRGIEERAKGYVAISAVVKQLVEIATDIFGSK